MTTSIEEVRESIKKLAETQERGFEEVRQTIKEVEESRKRGMAEVNQKFKEVSDKFKDVSERINQNSNEMRERINQNSNEMRKRINQVSGEMGNQWGQFIEKVATPNASRLLKERGFDVQETSTRVYNAKYGEVDSVALNGKEAVALEVKKHFKIKDIEKFMEVLALFKKESGLVQNKVLYGGIAFLSCDKDVVTEAEAQGLFVFRAFGDTATILNKKDFKPLPITHLQSEKKQ